MVQQQSARQYSKDCMGHTYDRLDGQVCAEVRTNAFLRVDCLVIWLPAILVRTPEACFVFCSDLVPGNLKRENLDRTTSAWC